MTKPRVAMILAAGLGTRMRPLTDSAPKPLLRVAQRPLIDHAIDRAIEGGSERVVINIHYLGDMIRAHLASRTDVEILFSDESDALLDTGGGLAKRRRFWAPTRFSFCPAIRSGLETPPCPCSPMPGTTPRWTP